MRLCLHMCPVVLERFLLTSRLVYMQELSFQLGGSLSGVKSLSLWTTSKGQVFRMPQELLFTLICAFTHSHLHPDLNLTCSCSRPLC